MGSGSKITVRNIKYYVYGHFNYCHAVKTDFKLKKVMNFIIMKISFSEQ